MSDNRCRLHYIFGFPIGMVSSMIKPALQAAIRHLSEEDIEKCIEEYISGVKIPALMDRFNIKCAQNQLYKILPPRILEETCRICGGTMIQQWLSRGSEEPYRIYCPLCKHQEKDTCRCSHCEELRDRQAEEENAKREVEIVKEVIAKRKRSPRLIDSVNSLSLPLAMAFLAFVRCSPVNEFGLYDPLDDCPVPYAPEGNYALTLLDSLCRAGLISLSEYSPIGTISYEDSQLSYKRREVFWAGDVEENIKLATQIEECGLSGDCPKDWHGEVEAVWLELALAECLEFYNSCVRERDLPWESDQSITSVLENMLRDFSVGKCYRIIWQGAESAVNFSRKNGIETPYMIGACQRWADQARANRYAVKALKRHRPRSMTSHVLFDVILKIGERGFTTPIE